MYNEDLLNRINKADKSELDSIFINVCLNADFESSAPWILKLLRKGANPNAEYPAIYGPFEGMSPAHVAVVYGNIDLLAALASTPQWNPNKRNADGETALEMARRAGKSELEELLSGVIEQSNGHGLTGATSASDFYLE